MRDAGTAGPAAELRARVERRHGTVYRFIRATGLSKTATYLALKGRYPADPGRILARIAAALAAETEDGGGPSQAQVAAALEQVACSRCSKPEAWRCPACRSLCQAQAAVLVELFGVQGVDHG